MRALVKTLWILAWLLVAAWAGWRWGPLLFPQLQQVWQVSSQQVEGASDEAGQGDAMGAVEGTAAPAATQELAQTALDRIEALRAGRAGGTRIELTADEVTSILRYALPGIVPPGVAQPSAEFVSGRLRLSAAVSTSAFPDFPAVAEVIGFLPVTAPVMLEASLLPFGPGAAAVHVERVEVARVPLPDRFISPILVALGRRPREGLPQQALRVPLPNGIRRVFVEADRLVLSSEE